MSRYDGMIKHRTIDCDACPHLSPIRGCIPQRTEEEHCNWGVAWKILITVNKPRKCMLINKGVGDSYGSNILLYLR